MPAVTAALRGQAAPPPVRRGGVSPSLMAQAGQDRVEGVEIALGKAGGEDVANQQPADRIISSGPIDGLPPVA